MKKYNLPFIFVLLAGWILSACEIVPRTITRDGAQETLYIYPNGDMEFRGRPIPKRDVVIYEDGYGGERAAVRVHMEPLHPDFFRDTIVVERVNVERTGDEEQAETD